ncbi:hypothetical protein [Microvirga lenta]|uniref:hypothetical protein n=1 Tax=Microvirga lenta TaxID=2881337 RepID=UPI001CFDAE9F|nr:hypothetical protein [Microvirga lenta]MCB5174303.1 hypothetical protein [Microvirga lenta]
MDLRNHSQDLSVARKQASGEASPPKEVAGPVRIDPKASAALAAAIASAKQPAKPAQNGESAKLASVPSPARRRGFVSARLPQAAAALALIGACWFASYAGTQAHGDSLHRAGLEASRSQDALGEALAKLSTDLEAVRTELAALKDNSAGAAQPEPAGQTDLAERLDALAAALRNPDVRSSALEARLERMEGQIMAALTAMAAKPAAPAAAAPAVTDAAVHAPEAAPAPVVKSVRNEPVSGWVLREVYNGAALVEGRNRRLYEVVPGGIVPGVGRVEAIERRGRDWVVLTDRGIIGSSYR